MNSKSYLNNIQSPCKICSLNGKKMPKQFNVTYVNTGFTFIECNHLNYIDYKYFQGSNDPWFCAICSAVLSSHLHL